MDLTLNKADYKILVVDDIDANTLLLKIILRKEGYQVLTTNNGSDAIRIAQMEFPDIILLDTAMPGLTGYEVAERLKSNSTTLHIPIIFLSTLVTPLEIINGFKHGGVDFISKPFNKDELVIRVSNQLTLVATNRSIEEKTAELKKIITERDKMYGIIAHDLKSPISTLNIIVEMLTSRISELDIDDEMKSLLRDANRMSEQVVVLLDNLLQWTKSQIGAHRVIRKEFNLNEVVEIETCLMKMVAQQKNIQFQIKKESSPIRVYADMDMIRVVIRNLIHNAIKFSYEGNRVIIQTKAVDGKAIFSVQDFGCGIRKNEQIKLLRSESHFSTYGTQNEEGSGLGLLICQDFIQQNKGKLWFESEEGEGSCFSFSIDQYPISSNPS